jgi:hypothetical protein
MDIVEPGVEPGVQPEMRKGAFQPPLGRQFSDAGHWRQRGARLQPLSAIAISVDGLWCRQNDRKCNDFKRLEMTEGFEDRKKGALAKWAHDEELAFKVMARRNKLLGQWAASELGLGHTESEAYAKAVVVADFEEAGDEDVFRKIRKDFDEKKVSAGDHIIRKKMEDLLHVAGEQVVAEKK